MVEGGPDCCRTSVRRVHKGRRVYSGRQALVQFLKVAKARLKPARSSAAREEGPLP
jgi:DNA primase large subunit